MEEGSKTKKTIFVGGVAEEVDEAMIYEHFSTFGDIIEVVLPPAAMNHWQQPSDVKHRGIAYVTYGSSADAQDAIDNMDMNELKGKVLKVNLARPMKTPAQLGGNRAIWESEEWLQEHVKPLAESGGIKSRTTRGRADEQSDAAGDRMEEDE